MKTGIFGAMRNWIWLTGPVLYILQLVLSFHGTPLFGKYGNPIVLFLVSMAIPAAYLWTKYHAASRDDASAAHPLKNAVLWGFFALFSMALCYEELRLLFVQFANPREFSDVLPQLETQYQRFRDGIFPYAPVDMGSYQPYPVYMPLHWLPVGIADGLNLDTRWVGYGLLGLAIALYGWRLPVRNEVWWRNAVAVVLPSLALWAFILWGGMEIPVSFELIIAAYYLVLAVGLYRHNLALVTLGLILCLLSRYTLVFWIPLFALLLLQNRPLRQSLYVWGAVGAAVVLLYILPFYLKDPGILSEGILYHNHAVEDEWKGYGDPPVSWSFERGIYFAPHMKAIFSGEMEHRVLLARMIQGGLMLLLFGIGLWGYRRLKSRLNWYDYCLAMLYVVIACFYFFGPLTYRYYLIVLFVLSAVLSGSIFLSGDRRRNAEIT